MVAIAMVLRQVVEAVLLLLAQTGLVIMVELAVLDRHQLLQAHLSLTLVVEVVVEIVAPVVLAVREVRVAEVRVAEVAQLTALLAQLTQAAEVVVVENLVLVAALAAAV
jgi:hypothetical protein